MLISTTPFIEGRPVREYKGAIYSQSILGANVVLDLLAAIRDFFGGRSSAYERVLARAREDAIKSLIKEAEKVGANAILAVDLDYNTVGPQASMLMVSVSGTAVVL
ncbi:MAG TPA: YbjQ family protein [Caulobacter sp.]|nr:YbjQ family protein [Caulobacter sp.]